MNGIGLLVLIVAAGQVGFTPPPTLSRDWGWEPDTKSGDNALCFIVQVSPEDALLMQTKGLENPANIPDELVGRARRVIFRIGTELLPQNPSLEELRKLPRYASPNDVTAQLNEFGQGRMTDVERDSVVNVQQDRSTPAFPNFGASAVPPSLDPNNIVDKAKQEAGNIIDKAKDLVRGSPSAPVGGPLLDAYPATTPPPSTSATAVPAYPNSPTTNRFDAINVQGAQAPNLPSTSGSDWRSALDNSRTRDDPTRTADNSRIAPLGQSGYGQGSYSQSNLAQGFPANPPAMDRGPFSGLTPLQTPASGYTTAVNGVRQGANSYGGGGYGGGNYGNGAYAGGAASYQAGPGYQRSTATQQQNGSPAARIASTPPHLTGGDSSASAPVDKTADATTSDPQLPRSKATEGILQVFFLLSLVVNFYLGMLIRKLLSRYRSLLANMRAQTA